ncbi:MAG: hypothetical protein OEY14_14250, partial [Myxococcales bacterium]|nr:hypothetical protein [Myxococcales bacterium]
LLVSRLARSRVQDADGVAMVALTAGSLVEHGAPAEALGEVLLAQLPEVLRAARRYADRCASGPTPPHPVGDDDPIVAQIDGIEIGAARFRAHLERDPGGGAALAYLSEWALPTIAALSRSRALLTRAAGDAQLRALVAALAESRAGWLHTLLGVQLGAPWLVLLPELGRGFRTRVDGVTSNWDLHALLADALIPLGVPGRANPRAAMAILRGEPLACERDFIEGSWELYDHRAAPHFGVEPPMIPEEFSVPGEGRPADIPDFEGERVLLLGAARLERSWSMGRPFEALRADVEVLEELAPAEVRAALVRLGAS